MNKTAIKKFATWANEREISDDLFIKLITTRYMEINCDSNGETPSIRKWRSEIAATVNGGTLLVQIMNRFHIDLSDHEFINNIEIIGWLYQYFNSSKKEKIFEHLNNNNKITKEQLPIATQFFTPDWLVKYLVENSLGRYWLENHPNNDLKNNWKYYIDTPPRRERIYPFRNLSPENITFYDPCMGSGHILVYAFDVFMQIYLSVGYNKDEAAKLILEKNIYGFDIDKNVYQLAYFSLLMKARQYSENILNLNIDLNLFHPNGNSNLEEFGSLYPHGHHNKIREKYDIVCTNPPYMGRKKLSKKLSQFLDNYYPEGKSELYSAFILRCLDLTEEHGFVAMITMHSWMFIYSFEQLRKKILEHTIVSMVHTGAATFDELVSFNVLSTAFTIRKKSNIDDISTFIRLTDYLSAEEKIKNFHTNRFYIKQHTFNSLPGKPFVYWISEKVINTFLSYPPLSYYYTPKQGLATGDNEKFVRFWWEIGNNFQEKGKWFPYNKGGKFRKWYGMNQFVVNWENDGYDIKNFKDENGYVKSRPQNINFYFKSGITWSLFGFETFSVRYKKEGFIFDVSSSSLFPDDDNLYYVLAFLASKVAFMYLSLLAPTVNFQIGNIGNLPLCINDLYKNKIETLAKKNIEIAAEDWDAFETSIDFKRHPLID